MDKHIKSGQCHFGNLMARHHTSLSGLTPYFPTNTVGIAHGNVEELPVLGCLIMSTGSIHHMTEIIEFVGKHLLTHPPFVASPRMRMPGIHGAWGIEIAVGLLGLTHKSKNRVHILNESLTLLLILHRHQHITGTFNGLINIGVIERKTRRRIVGRRILTLNEILVAPLAFTFRKGQRHGHFTCSLQTLAPESAVGHLHGSKGNGIDGIPRLC